MKHVTWIKNRSPHSSLNGISPYKMKHKKVPHLGNIHEFGIHEFGTVAYVKNLKPGKLDAHAKLGQFMGYDLEPKGFCIYLPNKQLNEMLYSTRKMYSPKVTMLLFLVMSCLRGRRIKSSSTPRIIQKLMLGNLTNKSSKTWNHKTLKIPESFHNSILFPPSEESQQQAPDGLETDPVIEPNMGCGHRPHHAPGGYARLNKGLE